MGLARSCPALFPAAALHFLRDAAAQLLRFGPAAQAERDALRADLAAAPLQAFRRRYADALCREFGDRPELPMAFAERER